MSRQNKVNPGIYTQRGRLTQDDAARELTRQRAVGSEHTWQPSKKDHSPRLASNNNDAALGAETSGDKKTAQTKSTATAKAKAKPSTGTRSRTAKKTAGGGPKPRKTAKRRKS